MKCKDCANFYNKKILLYAVPGKEPFYRKPGLASLDIERSVEFFRIHLGFNLVAESTKHCECLPPIADLCT